jgi:plasmid maintenance system antidote protein VapI
MSQTPEFLLTQLKARVAASTQKDVAKALKVSPQYLNDVLNERRGISYKLARAMGFKRRTTFDPVKAVRP